MRDWHESSPDPSERIETLVLRAGMSLVLSRFEPGTARQFHYAEPDDMVGIGFHLKGGSHFDVERNRFETQPLEAWAGAAPRGAVSCFTLPEHGFRTVSLRFSPEIFRDFLPPQRRNAFPLADIAARAAECVTFTRLSWLDGAASQLVQSMFSTPYIGAARTLFLESCALGLLAAQIDAGEPCEKRAGTVSNRVLRKKILMAREYLDAHFVEPPTIGALARIAGTNEFSLKRGFKEAFGVTVFTYVRQRRMELAMAELQAGRSVGDAARATGYECTRSFANAFRRCFGTLPSAIRAKLVEETPDHRG